MQSLGKTPHQMQIQPVNKQAKSFDFIGFMFLIVVLLSLVYVVYLTSQWMLDKDRLPLSRLQIQGDYHYTHIDDIQNVLGDIDTMGSFVSQDVDEIQNKVLSLPWVASVSIRKQWPDLISIHLIEHKPKAIWNDSHLLNEQGQVFDGEPSKLPESSLRFYGPDSESEQVYNNYYKWNEVFTSHGLSIQSITLNERKAWSIILDNSIRLELGRDFLQERIARFFTFYQKLDEERIRVSYIDLRYDTGAAIGWLPENVK
ncbi:cell division protein FtsQ/DivIB [Vibrio sp.]|nr:cell division protein FtsQ/DivIB [Vibrio sp.]